MRRVIRGRAYDTDKAVEIARIDGGDEAWDLGSDACDILFQNKNGAFFVVGIDHDGVPLSLEPLSRVNTKRWLKRHAPHLVEVHFGKVPEASARRTSARDPAVATISKKARQWKFDTVANEIDRALNGLENDPEDAITAACSLIESVCRSILVGLQKPLPGKKDIDGLIKAVQEPLGISPGHTDLQHESANDIRQILSGLTSVAKGIGALRTHAGDAHGREAGFQRADARIARLAIHSASSIALFLVETWEQKQHRPLPDSEAV